MFANQAAAAVANARAFSELDRLRQQLEAHNAYLKEAVDSVSSLAGSGTGKELLAKIAHPVSTYSTSLPAVETSRIRAAMSSGIGGIASRSRRPGPDQTRLTWSDSSSCG